MRTRGLLTGSVISQRLAIVPLKIEIVSLHQELGPLSLKVDGAKRDSLDLYGNPNPKVGQVQLSVATWVDDTFVFGKNLGLVAKMVEKMGQGLLDN